MEDNDIIIERIRKLREKGKLTQDQLAKALQINRTTYINLESGKKKITLHELEAICKVLGTNLMEIALPRKNLVKESEEKLKQLYYYILQMHFHPEGVPKTKLAKLLYLADFTSFYELGHSLSNAKYYRRNYGPVANSFFVLTDELFETGLINIKPLEYAQLISLSDSNEDMNFDIFTIEEKSIIDKICKYWKDKRTSEIVNFTHSQKAWKERNNGDYIPYESILEEPKNHVYAPI